MNFSKRVAKVELSEAKREVIRQAKSIVVYYPRFNEVLAAMEECMFFSAGLPEPQCMMFTGDTGVGKSCAITVFENAYPRTDVGHVTRVPVFSAVIPRPTQISGIATNMLASLGAPRPEKGSVTTKLGQLKTLFKTCGVRLIILDEFQHLIEHRTRQEVSDAADWIKTLINETKIPMVLCGMPSSTQVLDGFDQLRRRFNTKMELHPFDWDDDEAEFRDMLAAIDEQLPFKSPAGLAEDPLAPRLWLASMGKMSSLMQLIGNVAQDAILLDAVRLEPAMFANYWARKRGERGNPFEAKAADILRLLEKEREKEVVQ